MLTLTTMTLKQLLEKHRTPIIVFALLSIIAAFPIISTFSNWGQLDWDQHTFYHAVPRHTILSFFQFPLWNPYHCGGTAALANPQSTFLSPLYLLVLLFGEIYGLKLQIFAALFIGMLGMYFTSRQLKYGEYSSYLPAIVFFLSSWFALRANVGHTIYFSMAFFPWIFYFYLKSFEHLKYIIPAALFTAFLLFGGAVYPIVFIGLVLGLYGLFTAVQQKSLKPILHATYILALFALFAAIKLLPMIEFSGKYASLQEDTQYHSPSLLLNSLLARNQKELLLSGIFMPRDIPFEEVLIKRIGGELPWAWHEYGNYLGIIPMLMLIAGLYWYKRIWPLLASAAVLLLLALGDASPVNIWSMLHKLPLMQSLHGPSRFIISFTFFAALIIGYVSSRIEIKGRVSVAKRKISSKTIIIAVTSIIAIDLLLVSWPLYANTFDIKPPAIERSSDEIIPIWSSAPLISQYPNFLQGLATVDCYERVHPPIRALPAFIDTGEQVPQYNGEAYFPANNQTQQLLYNSPNKVIVNVQPDGFEHTLVLNRNYDSGWKAKGKEVYNYNGLVAAKVTPLDTAVTFYYLPASFLIGLVITIVTIIGSIIVFRKLR